MRFGLKKAFSSKKKKILQTYVISDLNHSSQEIVEIFYEKKLQKTNRKEFRVEKVIKKKFYRLHIK